MFLKPGRPLNPLTYLVARLVLGLFAVLLTTAYISGFRSGDLTTSDLGEPLFVVAFAAICIVGSLLRYRANR